MDIHPPLGKMLFAAVAYMLGFDGNFDFIPGK
jgi:dolichyl-phosphate-mannose-protein mannosyltransferase